MSGMPTNAVYVAWGSLPRPCQDMPGTFTWIYVCRDVQAYHTWKYREEIGGSPSFANVEDVLQRRARDILRPNNL
jgi:hypothetical protein